MTGQYKRYRAAGLCGECGVLAVDKGICPNCAEGLRFRQKAMRAKRKAAGLCQQCGKRKTKKPEDYYCPRCRKIQSARTASKYKEKI